MFSFYCSIFIYQNFNIFIEFRNLSLNEEFITWIWNKIISFHEIMNIIFIFGVCAMVYGLIFQGLKSLEIDNKSKYPRFFSLLRFSKNALKSHSLDPRRITEIVDWRLLLFDLILLPVPLTGYLDEKDNIHFSCNSANTTVQNCRRFFSLCHIFWLFQNNTLSIESSHQIWKGKKRRKIRKLYLYL